jgi:phospholipase C
VSRRSFLKKAAVAGGAVAAAGAGALGIRRLLSDGDEGGGPSPDPSGSGPGTTSPTPLPSPHGSPPPTVETRWPVKHVVYIMLENRSLNHMFGAFPGTTDTTRVGVVDGRETPLTVATEWMPADLPHDRGAALIDVNGGDMDGFGSYNLPHIDSAMSYNERDTVAIWWEWAKNFVLCDHVFASANSASYPNHLFMIAGTSGGAFDNPIQSAEVLDVRRDKGLAKTWGCDAPKGAFVQIYDYQKGDGGGTKDPLRTMPPCFTFDTQGQQLSRKKIDWAFYAANEREDGYIWNAYTAVDGVFNTELFGQHVRDVDHLVRDIRAGRLPSVTWVTPRYEFSNHPPYSTIWAQNWAASVINAIMRSPMWNSTAIFVTWDEWGGTYDPVTPPVVDALGLGVRVPMLVISPWANRGMVDHEVGEFTSPHKFIADNFDLAYLTDRVRNTHNFEHVFDFRRPTRRLLHPDPQAYLEPGPLPEVPPEANIGWPPPVSPPGA